MTESDVPRRRAGGACGAEAPAWTGSEAEPAEPERPIGEGPSGREGGAPDPSDESAEVGEPARAALPPPPGRDELARPVRPGRSPRSAGPDLPDLPDRVLPTLSDPVARGASTMIGGPWGRHAVVGRQMFWTPLRVCLALGIVVLAFAWIQKSPCRDGAWSDGKQYTHLCYSDIIPLYYTEHLNEDAVPYRDHPVEYPVLTGGFMYVSAEIARTYDDVASGGLLPTIPAVETYFDVTALLLVLCALAVIWGVSRLTGPRVWDAVMVALAPLVVVHAFTNWDLFAVALATLALVAWGRRRPVLAGVLLGLGTAAKLYPVLFLLPLFLLAWRTRKWADVWRTTLATAGMWLAVNVPVWLAYPEAWKEFFRLNSHRQADFDSLWHVLEFFTERSLDAPAADGDTPWTLNLLTFAAFLLVCGGVVLLTMMARRRPRLPQLLFLVVAGFLLTNKVWSPQYSLWLIPLAVLARPSWRAFLVWQATEVLLWFPRMYWFLGPAQKGIDEQWFLLSVLLRDGAVLVLCALIIHDVLRPEHDVVRAAGVDDPAGGVFDGAEDDRAFTDGWRWEPRRRPPPVPAASGPPLDAEP